MSLKDAVGTPAHPADPATIPAVAERLASAAVKVTGCATPILALNELYGARLGTPWSQSNAQYRANVLELVRALASRGTQPHLLISEAGNTTGPAAAWWRSLAESATIVREVYISGPLLEGLGPSGATVYLRFQLRRAVRNFTTIGVPSNRIGLALGFHSGRGGQAGLSAARWFGVVKRGALAARQVASELALDSVWSWGWARFAGMPKDPTKAAAACVYLWARSPHALQRAGRRRPCLRHFAGAAGRGREPSAAARPQPPTSGLARGSRGGQADRTNRVGSGADRWRLEILEQDRPRTVPPAPDARVAAERASRAAVLRRRRKRTSWRRDPDTAGRRRRSLAAKPQR
jgi:hypothetical protein